MYIAALKPSEKVNNRNSRSQTMTKQQGTGNNSYIKAVSFGSNK